MNSRSEEDSNKPIQIQFDNHVNEEGLMNSQSKINSADNYSEIQKIMIAYSKKKDTTKLTNSEFIELAHDLLETVGYPKRLTDPEIKSVFNMIDNNNDGYVSVEEVARIAAQNKISNKKM